VEVAAALVAEEVEEEGEGGIGVGPFKQPTSIPDSPPAIPEGVEGSVNEELTIPHPTDICSSAALGQADGLWISASDTMAEPRKEDYHSDYRRASRSPDPK
jgi:hypothetical protein